MPSTLMNFSAISSCRFAKAFRGALARLKKDDVFAHRQVRDNTFDSDSPGNETLAIRRGE
jgi:hypothetical protein